MPSGNRQVAVFIFLMVLLVLVVTLFPYDFRPRAPLPDDSQGLVWHWDVGNILANIILFAPLGFGLAQAAGKRGHPWWVRTLLSLGIGFCLSAFVESLQVSLPSRFPSFTDVASNTAGSVLGVWLHQRHGDRILWITANLANRLEQFGKRSLVAAALIYLALMFGIEMNARRNTSLATWDDSYPLILGNEHTANRPWRGRVLELGIADQAWSPEQVAEFFASVETADEATGNPMLPDSFSFQEGAEPAAGNRFLPELVWKGSSPDAATGKNGVRLSPERWLESPGAATDLTRRLRQKDQFTLAVVCATRDPSQTGPARIVSVSRDPYNRNFTLGQSGSDLVVRLRTRFTGDNGSRPEHVVPDVLGTGEPRHLVVTYADGVEHVYIDGVDRRFTMDLRYAARVCWIFFRFDERNLFGFKVAYFAIVLMPPAGFILWLIGRVAKRRHPPPASRSSS